MITTGASAGTGFVRGRNGISFQWRGRTIRTDGFIESLPDWRRPPTVPPPSAGIPMLEGTNMAIRRDVLARIGGFDPAFRFYMDDADLSIRLAAAGHRVAVVPLAQVHHGFAASADAGQIACRPTFMTSAAALRCSSARIWRRDGRAGTCPPPRGRAAAPPAVHGIRSRRAARRGGTPRAVRRRRRGGDARSGGFGGGDRPSTRGCPSSEPSRRRRPRSRRAIRSRGSLRRAAADAEGWGDCQPVPLLANDLYHRVRFDAAGFWEQMAGYSAVPSGRRRCCNPEALPRASGRSLRVLRKRGVCTTLALDLAAD